MVVERMKVICKDNILGLHEILKMHCLWLSGTENLEVKEIYHLEEVCKVDNWCEFFNCPTAHWW